MKTFVLSISALFMLWVTSGAFNVATNQIGAARLEPQLQSPYVTFSWFMAFILLLVTGILAFFAIRSAVSGRRK